MANATTTQAPKTKTETKEKDSVTIALQVPPELKTRLEQASEADKVTVARFIRALVADELQFDLTAFERRTRSRGKYTSDEEREKARKASADKRNDVIKALMKKYKAGEINISDEEVAALAAESKRS